MSETQSPVNKDSSPPSYISVFPNIESHSPAKAKMVALWDTTSSYLPCFNSREPPPMDPSDNNGMPHLLESQLPPRVNNIEYLRLLLGFCYFVIGSYVLIIMSLVVSGHIPEAVMLASALSDNVARLLKDSFDRAKGGDPVHGSSPQLRTQY